MMVEREPESGLREVVHQRVRLGVLAVLDRQGPCTFSQLRDVLGQSDGGLSRHLGVLEEHGFVATEKVFENRRPRTWVRMTPAGVEAFREEQELLGKLLAAASDGADGDERTAAMTIVFAALLAGEDTGGSGAPPTGTDRSGLVPSAPEIVAGRQADQVATGAITPGYDFPAHYRDMTELREQRLMMVSHGLRGGWITTWRVPGDDERGDLTAQAMVVELGGERDCEAILAVTGPPTVDLPDVPGARGYLLPGGDDGSPATAVAWFAVGTHLVSVVVVAEPDLAVPGLERLATEVRGPLSARRP